MRSQATKSRSQRIQMSGFRSKYIGAFRVAVKGFDAGRAGVAAAGALLVAAGAILISTITGEDSGAAGSIAGEGDISGDGSGTASGSAAAKRGSSGASVEGTSGGESAMVLGERNEKRPTVPLGAFNEG
jgi:hypothetical protein